MSSRQSTRSSYELLATIGKPCWHIPELVWNVHARLGDPLSRGALQRRGVREPRVREVQQLSGARHMACSYPLSVPP